jgi:hypothetical protein
MGAFNQVRQTHSNGTPEPPTAEEEVMRLLLAAANAVKVLYILLHGSLAYC